MNNSDVNVTESMDATSQQPPQVEHGAVSVDEVAELKCKVQQLLNALAASNQMQEELMLEIRMLRGIPVCIH